MMGAITFQSPGWLWLLLALASAAVLVMAGRKARCR